MPSISNPDKAIAKDQKTNCPIGKTKRLGVDIPESYYEAFFLKARINKTDMSTLIRQWIKDYLEAQ